MMITSIPIKSTSIYRVRIQLVFVVKIVTRHSRQMDSLVASPLLERVLDEERRHHRIQEGLNLQLVKMHHGASPHTAVSPSRDSRR